MKQCIRGLNSGILKGPRIDLVKGSEHHHVLDVSRDPSPLCGLASDQRRRGRTEDLGAEIRHRIKHFSEDPRGLFLWEESLVQEPSFLFSNLIVRFDEGHDPLGTGWVEPSKRGRNCQPLWRPGQIHHHEVDAVLWRVRMQGVGSLADLDSVVLPKRPGEDAAPGLHGDHAGRAALKEAVGKSADIRAKVGTSEFADIKFEFVEAVFDLQAGSAGEFSRRRRWIAGVPWNLRRRAVSHRACSSGWRH